VRTGFYKESSFFDIRVILHKKGENKKDVEQIVFQTHPLSYILKVERGRIMFVLVLLTTILPVVIVIFTIAYISKNKNKEDEETMIRHLYTYLVLFATLMMVIGGGISIFMATADLVSPGGYFQSFSDYEVMRESEKIGGNTQISEEELRADYEQMIEDEKARTRENAKNQMIKSLGFIVIPLPIFIYFSRMRKKQIE
jgi:hypothetical protein